MSNYIPMSFEQFRTSFVALYQQALPQTGGPLREYLLAGGKTGDEASIVDTVLTGAALELLGFDRIHQVYNQQKRENRPDFAPSDDAAGLCFLVEDKATGETLDLELTHERGHLRQLQRYALAEGSRLGVLTNGRRWTGWRFEGERAEPISLFDFDALSTFEELSPELSALRTLFDLFSRDAFTEPLLLEDQLATDEASWRAQAKPLGAENATNQTLLVDALRDLVYTLSHDAERRLQEYLTRFDDYDRQVRFLDDGLTERADSVLESRRQSVLSALGSLQNTLHLVNGERAEIEGILATMARDPRAFATPQAIFEAVLAIINTARAKRWGADTKAGKPWKSLADIPNVEAELKTYVEKVLVYHQRRNALGNAYREAIQVREDYELWCELVQETMLGDLTETDRRAEFALQAAYVVTIRLLLIRVCEDKGILRHRLLSDGGLANWKDNIERYFQFANGNPYAPLLDLAYKNAQNIYAHFFTGRELFNWFSLERRSFLLALSKLNGFDFADVDSDIIGTVYGTYLTRKEKKKRGQYYTPPEIVTYLLDHVGYVKGPAIIGQQKRLLDPACGSGSFLVTAARRLLEAYAGMIASDPEQVLERVRGSLYGFDLNPFACYLAEVNLLIQLLPLVKAVHEKTKRAPRLQRFHIYNVDALTLSTRSYFTAQTGATLMREERDEVERIKDRTQGSEYATGFAFILGNPPYGASLTDIYKKQLKDDYADVWRGQPDTYVFFYRLAVRLLGTGGKLGFITPNTFLMGVNTTPLRSVLLNSCRIQQIVDLPQGIWQDATVDCILFLATQESDAAARSSNTITVKLLGLKDALSKLTNQQWSEELTHSQSTWLTAAPGYEMPIRTDALLEQIEKACEITTSTGPKILHLGDVTESSQGIIPYLTEAEGKANLYIKPRRELPLNENDWKPLLDTNSYVGRYELRWGSKEHFIKWGSWLARGREAKYFEIPKILVQDMRNKSLARRLVGVYDESKFYNRHNFNNIISLDGSGFDLKYLTSLFNSSVLNYWYARKFDNVHVNPSYFRSLPVFPATAEVQAELVVLVDRLLGLHAQLNALRAADYVIKPSTKHGREIQVPFDKLIDALRAEDANFPLLTLFDLEAAGDAILNEGANASTTVSSNVFVPTKFPHTLVLRHRELYLTIPDDELRRYLLAYLARPLWTKRPYSQIRNAALVPATPEARARFFAREAAEIQRIHALLDDVAATDATLDNCVLDLYGITAPADRARILGSAPVQETEEE